MVGDDTYALHIKNLRDWPTHDTHNRLRHALDHCFQPRQLTKYPGGWPEPLNKHKEFVPKVRCFQQTITLAKSVIGNDIDGYSTQAMVQIHRLAVLDCVVNGTAKLQRLVLDDIFKFNNNLTREERIEASAANAVQFIVWGGER